MTLMITLEQLYIAFRKTIMTCSFLKIMVGVLLAKQMDPVVCLTLTMFVMTYERIFGTYIDIMQG